MSAKCAMEDKWKKGDSQQVLCETGGLKRFFVKDAKIDTFVGDESNFWVPFLASMGERDALKFNLMVQKKKAILL